MSKRDNERRKLEWERAKVHAKEHEDTEDCGHAPKAWPLGKNVTALMSDSCPRNVCAQRPSRRSHRRAWASHATDTNCWPPGAREMLITSPAVSMGDCREEEKEEKALKCQGREKEDGDSQ